MALRIACLGGGPGGLFFAALAKLADPDREVTVFERNALGVTFGFGVVFSDATLASIEAADPVVNRALSDCGVYWDTIEVRLKGETFSCSGNGMAAIERKTLLNLLYQRAFELGVDIRSETAVTAESLLQGGYDLVVASDGANSVLRGHLQEFFEPRVDVADAKFIWFGTTYGFDQLTFAHEMDVHGVFAAHAYPYSPDASTFIVETDLESWRSAGLDEFDVDQPPGPSDVKTKAYLEGLFENQLKGHPLLENNSRWGSFRTWRAKTWHARAADGTPVVLIGDAAHTAHFSVGSGTKMAMEDAVALANALDENSDIDAALVAYEAVRQPQVARIQDSARPSLSWWEHFGRSYQSLPPWQFAYHFLSRSLSDMKLRTRDADFVESSHRRWSELFGAAPLESPLSARGIEVESRRVAITREGSQLCLSTKFGPLKLVEDLGGDTSDEPWGLWVVAPVDEADLDPACERILTGLRRGASLVAVTGGTAFTRRLLTEKFRLEEHTVTVLVEECDDDAATTAVLSGRTDLVASPPS